MSVTVDPMYVLSGSSIIDKDGHVMKKIKLDSGKNEKGKPLLDLSKEPPPPEWMKAYANGEHRRRELRFWSGPEHDILFYDYDPKYKVSVSWTEPIIKLH